MTRVAIIILNWNSPADSIHCIESLLAQKPVAPDIVLVDNYSGDDSIRILRQYIDTKDAGIHLIENPVNAGFAGGINVGIKHCLAKNYEYIGMLNPDAKAGENWLSALLAEFVDTTVGSVTGLMLSADGSVIDSSGDFYTIWGIPEARDRNQPVANFEHPAGEVFGGTGGGVVYRSSVLEKIGGFDERFFMYYEDIDLAFRAQLAGYTARFTPKAIAYHDRGTSSKKIPGLVTYQTFRNMPSLFWKNVPLNLVPTILPRFFVAYALLLIHTTIAQRNLSALKGWLASLTILLYNFKLRREIQKSKKVPIDQLRKIIVHDLPSDQTGLRKLRGIFIR